MAEAPTHQRRESGTLKFARWVVRHRGIAASFLIVSTLFFFYPILNTAVTAITGTPLPGPSVRVDTDARALWPDHPFIHAQDKFSGKFGTSSLVALAIVTDEETIFTPDTLAAIDEATKRLDGLGFDSQTDAREELRDELDEQGLEPKEIQKQLDREYPPYPVNHYQVSSVTHSGTRVIQIEASGDITSDVLMKGGPPESPEAAAALADVVRQNPPFIYGRLVSQDMKGALVTAGFVTDRLSGREVYQAVFDHVQQIKADIEREHPHLTVYVSGEPILVGWILIYAFQIVVFVALTVTMIFALLWLYFRRWHGVLIPAIAALATVIWGLGFTGWVGITFDPLILVIPTIITARAISHTVQMAERFFEDYEILHPTYDDPEDAKFE
ncbi:MAG: MMPL family transporter, partial [Proteobacteria bacterium]|nr:MMPL family transporter [Pseudomonadota bacterium]